MSLKDKFEEAGVEGVQVIERGIFAGLRELISAAVGAVIGTLFTRYFGKRAGTAVKKAVNGDTTAKEELTQEIERGFAGYGYGEEAIVLRNLAETLAELAILCYREEQDGKPEEALKMARRVERLLNFLSGLPLRILKRFAGTVSKLQTQEERLALMQHLMDILILEEIITSNEENKQVAVLEKLFKIARIDTPPFSEGPIVQSITQGFAEGWNGYDPSKLTEQFKKRAAERNRKAKMQTDTPRAKKQRGGITGIFPAGQPLTTLFGGKRNV